jgi:hypothetical protein
MLPTDIVAMRSLSHLQQHHDDDPGHYSRRRRTADSECQTVLVGIVLFQQIDNW